MRSVRGGQARLGKARYHASSRLAGTKWSIICTCSYETEPKFTSGNNECEDVPFSPDSAWETQRPRFTAADSLL